MKSREISSFAEDYLSFCIFAVDMQQIFLLLALLIGRHLRMRVDFKIDVAASLKSIADIVRAIKGR